VLHPSVCPCVCLSILASEFLEIGKPYKLLIYSGNMPIALDKSNKVTRVTKGAI